PPHRAPRQLAEERFELRATKLLLKDDLALRIFAVDLKNRLGQIETDRDSVHVDGSYRWLANRNNDQFGTSMPSGAVHPASRATAMRSRRSRRSAVNPLRRSYAALRSLRDDCDAAAWREKARLARRGQGREAPASAGL